MPSLRSVGVYRFLAILIAAFACAATAAYAQGAPTAPITGLDDVLNGAGGGLSRSTIQLFLLISVLSLVPAIAMMVTCLPFMVIVFSFMRQAIGVPRPPPT